MTDHKPSSANEAEGSTQSARHPHTHESGGLFHAASPESASPESASDQNSAQFAPKMSDSMGHQPLATDGQLVDFLRHHRPSPPPANPAIEQALLQKIQDIETQTPHRPWQWWAGGLGALAIGCVALFSGNNSAQNHTPSIADAELERFIEETWVITVAPNTLSTTAANTDDLLPWSFDPATWDSGPTKLVSKSLSAMVISPATKPYL